MWTGKGKTTRNREAAESRGKRARAQQELAYIRARAARGRTSPPGMSFWLPYSLLSSHTVNLRNRINEERRQNRTKDIRIAELQREVELLEQRANDQAAELEALRASNKKQGRLIRAIRPLSRGRGCRILGHVIGGELGPGKFLMGDGHSLPSSPRESVYPVRSIEQ